MVLLLIVCCSLAAATSYPGIATLNSFDFLKSFTNTMLKYQLQPEYELPLLNLPIKDDHYSNIYFADSVLYNLGSNCTEVIAGGESDTIRMGIMMDFQITGNMEIIGTSAPNIVANYIFSTTESKITLDTTFRLKNGYQQFQGTLQGVEDVVGYKFAFRDSGDVPLPTPADQRTAMGLVDANERALLEQVFIALNNYARTWYNWANERLLGYNLYDGHFTNHKINLQQVVTPMIINGTQPYMGLFFNGTYVNGQDLGFSPSATLENEVDVVADNIYRYSGWWMSQFFYENFAKFNFTSIYDDIVSAIPQLAATFGADEEYYMKLVPDTAPKVAINTQYQTYAGSLLFEIAPKSSAFVPALTLRFGNYVKAATQFYQTQYKDKDMYYPTCNATVISYQMLHMEVLQSNLTEKVDGATLATKLSKIAEDSVLPYYTSDQYPVFLTGVPNIWYYPQNEWSISIQNGYLEVAANNTKFD